MAAPVRSAGSNGRAGVQQRRAGAQPAPLAIVTVYLIRSELEPGVTAYKIGITRRSAPRRVKELQTGNPNALELVTTYQSPVGTLLETALHRSYPLVLGEWFRLTDAEVLGFAAMCERCERALLHLKANTYWNRRNADHRPDDDWDL